MGLIDLWNFGIYNCLNLSFLFYFQLFRYVHVIAEAKNKIAVFCVFFPHIFSFLKHCLNASMFFLVFIIS